MKILLTTFHAKYAHSSLALPSLAASCAEVADCQAVIREYTVNEPRSHLLRRIIDERADLIAFSCYIWNIELTLRIASDIKLISPDTIIVLGGPEASFGIFELMHENPAIDFVIKGEGEATFQRLLTILKFCGDNFPGSELENTPNLFYRDQDDIAMGPHGKDNLILDSLPSPFQAGLVDLTKPLVYYETSRGCPFSCAFCLSSVEGRVRSYSMDRIKRDLLFLMERQVGQIKLVDRTFNYDDRRAIDIWRFILEHNQGSRFHFEIAADLLSDSAIELLAQVPPDIFHFEIGVQSADAETLRQVNRTSDLGRLWYVIRRLRAETAVELHLDLVAGLPGENFDGFITSLRKVMELQPHQIQIEPLKVLKGSPMREIARREGYRFSSFPPYAILGTPWLSYDDISRIETIGRLLDLFCNNGGFEVSWQHLGTTHDRVAILASMARQTGAELLAGRSLRRLYELFAELTAHLLNDTERSMFLDALFYDYCSREMPLQGKLPSFTPDWHCKGTWPKPGDLPSDVPIPANARVKSFRTVFQRNYRIEPAPAAATEITFVYASRKDSGLSVHII